jgi:hypothetical protein
MRNCDIVENTPTSSKIPPGGLAASVPTSGPPGENGIANGSELRGDAVTLFGIVPNDPNSRLGGLTVSRRAVRAFSRLL